MVLLSYTLKWYHIEILPELTALYVDSFQMHYCATGCEYSEFCNQNDGKLAYSYITGDTSAVVPTGM